MVEKRRVKRLKDYDEIVLTVFADGKKFPKEKFSYNHSKDVSVLGVGIKGDIYLPAGSIIRATMKLNSRFPITIIGQVKWVKAIKDEGYYEAGVEFFVPPNESIKNLKEYISWLGEVQKE
ncbi:MAG: PilZ domain-containing protein [Syntrophaceae bacterium]|nr:PilZ domain-containing protein [Syntrophaceae bacterium]